MRLMLDKVIAPEQYPQVVEEQVSPYCCRHQMNLDQTLVRYVKVRGWEVEVCACPCLCGGVWVCVCVCVAAEGCV